MFCPLKGLSRETNMLTGERIGVLVPLPTPSALMGNGRDVLFEGWTRRAGTTFLNLLRPAIQSVDDGCLFLRKVVHLEVVRMLLHEAFENLTHVRGVLIALRDVNHVSGVGGYNSLGR
jgi:hypothetical protein